MSEDTPTFVLVLVLIGVCFFVGTCLGRDSMRDECLDALSNAEMQCFDTDHCVIGASGKWVRTADGWEKGVAP